MIFTKQKVKKHITQPIIYTTKNKKTNPKPFEFAL